jgi:hypothetical protein
MIPISAASGTGDPLHTALRPPRAWTLGRLAPLTLALWLVVDVGTRFLPLGWFGVPALVEAVRLPGPNSPFAPNLELRGRPFVGEAAITANLPPSEWRPPLNFTTDELGFRRNPYLTPGARPDVLFLLGASYTYGAGLSDEETLPATFSRISGIPAYNAGRFHTDDVNNLGKLDWLLARLPARPPVAVLVHLDYETPSPPPVSRSRLVAAAQRVHPAFVPAAERASNARRRAGWMREVATRWLRVSPVDIASTRLSKALGNDRLLPNEYKDAVDVMRLPNGAPLLFREFELEIARRGRSAASVQATADYFAWWRGALARRGIESYVLLVPTRYTLYGPWIEGGRERATAMRAAAELDALETALGARGIRAINALPALRRGVEEEVRTGRLSFYREDNHWNARGVESVARAVAAVLGEPRAPEPGVVAERPGAAARGPSD